MASWASTRKFAYTAGVIFFFMLIAGGVYFAHYYEAPSCTDKKQNQDEEGIDCGGSCAVVCTVNIADPIVLWSRAFRVVDGLYNAVAYVENPNPGVGVQTATYRFKLYDENNVLVLERVGKVFIAPKERFAVFEPRLNTGNRVPARAFFEFIKFSDWTKIPEEAPKIIVRGEKFSSLDSSPRVDAILQNSTIADIHDIDVVALVYDGSDNAIAVSATKVDVLKADSTYNLAFTWEQPFSSAPSRAEIIPRLDLSGVSDYSSTE
ncbi:MAG: hypothetical protein HYT94_02770 [Parcubacteria group bacterium]|nr:hypothetical protein [Parcubacteria group bacterium]